MLFQFILIPLSCFPFSSPLSSLSLSYSRSSSPFRSLPLSPLSASVLSLPLLLSIFRSLPLPLFLIPFSPVSSPSFPRPSLPLCPLRSLPLSFPSLSLPLSCCLSYELVRQLQALVSSQLSPLVTRRLRGLSLEGDGHSSAAQLTEDILASAQ